MAEETEEVEIIINHGEDLNEQVLNEEGSQRQRRNAYTRKRKLEVVEYAKKNGNKSADSVLRKLNGFSECWDDWMTTPAEHSRTAKGNMRPPSMDTYLQWVVNAWESLPSELIKRSFKICGITNEIGGTEDHLIHCFKLDGACPEGMELLKKARDGERIDELAEALEDAFIGEENEYDSDASIE